MALSMEIPSKIHIETSRLQLRDIGMCDLDIMYALDSDPLVAEAIGGGPKSLEVVKGYIQFVNQQYVENGFGRWAIVLKETNNEVIGWAGLKIEHNVNNHDSFYDIGYRLLPKYWNQGFATEASLAVLEYGFEMLHCNKICAYAVENNPASIRVLEKIGLKHISSFQGDRCKELWMEISAEEYAAQHPKKLENTSD